MHSIISAREIGRSAGKYLGEATLDRVIWRGLYEQELLQMGRKALKEQLWHIHEAERTSVRPKHQEQSGEGLPQSGSEVKLSENWEVLGGSL